MSGKQYGLILNKKTGSGVAKSNVFNESESEDEDVGNKDWIKKSMQKRFESNFSKKESKIAVQKALEEDSTVYQYDEIYDQMEAKKMEKVKTKEKDRKPKYIEKLLETSERRKREGERRIERQIQKERQAEGDKFKDKESFVTSAYKKKLEDMALMDEEERRMDRLEEIGDVTKQQDISGFYRHLYQSTVTGDQRPPAATDKPSDATDKPPVATDKLNKDNGKKRNYRKRKQSPDASDNDNDSDSSASSSSSDSSDQDEPPQKKRSRTPDKKARVKTTTEDEKKPEPKEAKTKEEKQKSKPEKKKQPDVSIWEKRTVGAVFDAALERYLQRKAQRTLANRKG